MKQHLEWNEDAMQYYTIEELKAKILAGLDVLQFLDALGVSFAELIDKFEEEIEENYEDLVDCLGETPYY